MSSIFWGYLTSIILGLKKPSCFYGFENFKVFNVAGVYYSNVDCSGDSLKPFKL